MIWKSKIPGLPQKGKLKKWELRLIPFVKIIIYLKYIKNKHSGDTWKYPEPEPHA